MADHATNSYEGLAGEAGAAANMGKPGVGEGTGFLTEGGLDAAMDRVEQQVKESGSPLADFDQGLPGSPPPKKGGESEEGAEADKAAPEAEETETPKGGEQGEASASGKPARTSEETKALADAIRTLRRHHAYDDDEITGWDEETILARAEKVRPLVERNDQAYRDLAELKRTVAKYEELLGGREQPAGHQPGDEAPHQTNLSELAKAFASDAGLDDQAASAFERVLAGVRAPVAQENAQLRELASGLQEALRDTYWDRAEGTLVREYPELESDPTALATVREVAEGNVDLQGLSAKEAQQAMQEAMSFAAQAFLFGRERNQQVSSERRAQKRLGQPRTSGRKQPATRPKGGLESWDERVPELMRKHGLV